MPRHFAYLLLAGLAACASTPEPGKIALSNATGEVLQSMTVGEAREEGDTSPLRLGRIAPAFPGRPFVFVRRPDAERLPKRAQVSWQLRSGAVGSRTVDLGEVLKRATGAPDEALFFELRPGGRVVVFLGRVPPPP
ncbi:MAG: hypothetical protein ACYTG3_10460 [Planctomycetota bacterium]|jgi:hypothetical protein